MVAWIDVFNKYSITDVQSTRLVDAMNVPNRITVLMCRFGAWTRRPPLRALYASSWCVCVKGGSYRDARVSVKCREMFIITLHRK